MSTRDPTDVLAEAEEREVAESRALQLRRQEIEDFKWVMAHKPGRRFMNRLLSTSGVFRTSMTGNSTTFFNEGRREIGLQLMAEINEHSIEAYVLMMKEAQAK